MFDGIDVEDLFVVTATHAETELTDSEFRMGDAGQRLDVVVGVASLVVDDLV